MADPAARAILAADLGARVEACSGPCGTTCVSGGTSRSGLNAVVDALVEGEVDVPRLEILGDVREVHVRALAEVAAVAEIDEAERLEVRDLPGPEGRPSASR